MNSDAGQKCPWGLGAGWAIAILFPLMFVCLVFDLDAAKLLRTLCWLTLALAAVADGEGSRRRRLLPVVVSWLFIILSAAAAAWFYGHLNTAVHYFIRYQIGVVWLAVLWLAAPIGLQQWSSRKLSAHDGLRPVKRWAAWLTLILLLFAFNATLSAAASLFPKQSMELLGSEILPYAGLFIIIKRSAWCIGNRWWVSAARAVWILVIVTAVCMAVVAVLGLSSPQMSALLVRHGYFRIDSLAPDTPRLQFLFQHHNRAGFFAACAISLSIAGAWGGRWWRIAGIAGAFAAGLALPFTTTRGALVAAALGMALFSLAGLVRSRRGRWTLVVGLVVAAPLLWFMLPQMYRGHIAKITNPGNYHENTGGSIGARLVMWETAADMIRSRPGLGFGYGFENFESAAKLDHPSMPHFFEGASHAHNHWLETAAETGLPGFMLLLAFTILRIAGLALAWWRGIRRGYGFAWLLLLWLCLEGMIQMYGMTNYTLRRNLGFLTYWIWAGSAVLVIMAARDEVQVRLAGLPPPRALAANEIKLKQEAHFPDETSDDNGRH